MNVIGLSPEHEANLRKLAAYLASGNLRAAFSMTIFDDATTISHGMNKTDCGSCGCAIGHGPYAGIPKNPGERWTDYSQRAFGPSVNLDCGDEPADNWLWCFDSAWFDVDNTPSGAAKRILWLLDNGLPEDWDEQRIGTSPLCYV